jgi:hypothetical protein
MQDNSEETSEYEGMGNGVLLYPPSGLIKQKYGI